MYEMIENSTLFPLSWAENSLPGLQEEVAGASFLSLLQEAAALEGEDLDARSLPASAGGTTPQGEASKPLLELAAAFEEPDETGKVARKGGEKALAAPAHKSWKLQEKELAKEPVKKLAEEKEAPEAIHPKDAAPAQIHGMRPWQVRAVGLEMSGPKLPHEELQHGVSRAEALSGKEDLRHRWQPQETSPQGEDRKVPSGSKPQAAAQKAAAAGRPSRLPAEERRQSRPPSDAPARQIPPPGEWAEAVWKPAAMGGSPAVADRPELADREPVDQVGRQIALRVAGGNLKTFTMDLYPKDLGAIRVKLKLTGDRLTIDIAAGSSRTQSLLAGRVDRLVQSMGLKDVRVEAVRMDEGNHSSNLPLESRQSGDFSQGSPRGHLQQWRQERSPFWAGKPALYAGSEDGVPAAEGAARRSGSFSRLDYLA